ncbi:hypothetical protein GCM10027447_11780 [Glycomyces halotolerans]
MKTVTVSISARAHQQLEEAARRDGVAITDIARSALEEQAVRVARQRAEAERRPRTVRGEREH